MRSNQCRMLRLKNDNRIKVKKRKEFKKGGEVTLRCDFKRAHKRCITSSSTSTAFTLIMATKGMTLFMYFFSSGMAPNSLAITLLSGRAPLLLWTDPDKKKETEMVRETDKQKWRLWKIRLNLHDHLWHRSVIRDSVYESVYECLFLTL